MLQTKTLSLNKNIALSIIKFAVLLAIAVVTPALIHNQPITGPIVNAVLFLGVVLLGAQNAILLGLMPSVVALSFGLLPAPLAPMIPFIMLSNVILVITFSYLRKKNFWLGAIAASLIKFAFLYATSFAVINLITQKPLAQKAAQMMSYPQLLTALAGALLAYIILKTFKKN